MKNPWLLVVAFLVMTFVISAKTAQAQNPDFPADDLTLPTGGCMFLDPMPPMVAEWAEAVSQPIPPVKLRSRGHAVSPPIAKSTAPKLVVTEAPVPIKSADQTVTRLAYRAMVIKQGDYEGDERPLRINAEAVRTELVSENSATRVQVQQHPDPTLLIIDIIPATSKRPRRVTPQTTAQLQFTYTHARGMVPVELTVPLKQVEPQPEAEELEKVQLTIPPQAIESTPEVEVAFNVSVNVSQPVFQLRSIIRPAAPLPISKEPDKPDFNTKLAASASKYINTSAFITRTTNAAVENIPVKSATIPAPASAGAVGSLFVFLALVTVGGMKAKRRVQVVRKRKSMYSHRWKNPYLLATQSPKPAEPSLPAEPPPPSPAPTPPQPKPTWSVTAIKRAQQEQLLVVTQSQQQRPTVEITTAETATTESKPEDVRRLNEYDSVEHVLEDLSADNFLNIDALSPAQKRILEGAFRFRG